MTLEQDCAEWLKSDWKDELDLRDFVRAKQREAKQRMIEVAETNQKGQFEDDQGVLCWYLDDLLEALNDEITGNLQTIRNKYLQKEAQTSGNKVAKSVLIADNKRLYQEAIHYSELHNEAIQEIACIKEEVEKMKEILGKLVERVENGGALGSRDYLLAQQLLKDNND